MTDTRCRITAVRFKNGGEIRLLRSQVGRNHDECMSAIDEARRQSADALGGRVAGYAFMAWSADGSTFADYKVTSTSPYATSAVPKLAAEGVRSAATRAAIQRFTGC